MAFSTYDELKANIAARADRTDLDDVIPDFIRIAELDIARSVRAMWNQKRAYAVPDSGFVAFPNDYLELVNIQFTSGDNRYTLEQVSPHLIDQISASNSAGIPRYYAVHDNQLEIRPSFASDSTTELEITYYFMPEHLAEGVQTNEILDNAPDMLLYRSLAEAHDYMFDEQRVSKYMQLYERALADIRRSQHKAKWSGVPLRIRVDHQDRI